MKSCRHTVSFSHRSEARGRKMAAAKWWEVLVVIGRGGWSGLGSINKWVSGGFRGCGPSKTCLTRSFQETCWANLGAGTLSCELRRRELQNKQPNKQRLQALFSLSQAKKKMNMMLEGRDLSRWQANIPENREKRCSGATHIPSCL